MTNVINLKLYKPLIISGPSGVGKSTLIKKLMMQFDIFSYSISHTTRLPRNGEVDEIDYHFIDYKMAEIMKNNKSFLEYTKIHDNIYGTARYELEKIKFDNKIAILDLDLNGIKSFEQSKYPSNYLYILPPNKQILEDRLIKRNTETKEQIKKRLIAANEYDNIIMGNIIINDNLDNAYLKFINVIENMYNINLY